MKLKYLVCILAGAVSFFSATAAWGGTHGPRIWAITHNTSPDPKTGLFEYDLYKIDMGTGDYTNMGRLPHVIDGIEGGDWGGLAVKDHNLYFCSSQRYHEGTKATSEVIMQLDSGDTNNITYSGGFIKLKKTTDVGFLANIGGMCVGPDGKFYLSVPFTTNSSSQLPPPGDISALFRRDPSLPPPAKAVGWFDGTVKVVGGKGKKGFYADLDYQPSTDDLFGVGVVDRLAPHNQFAIYRLDHALYPLLTGTSMLFDFNSWYSNDEQPGGLAFSRNTGELYITKRGREVWKYNQLTHVFDEAYKPKQDDRYSLGCIKVEEECGCEKEHERQPEKCRPCPRPPRCRWYIPRLHLCLDWFRPIYAQMMMISDMAEASSQLPPNLSKDIEASHLRAITKLANERLAELKRSPVKKGRVSKRAAR